jgi:hypothetical protein
MANSAHSSLIGRWPLGWAETVYWNETVYWKLTENKVK